MTNEPGKALRHLVTVHTHPEEMAGVEVGRERMPESGYALECLDVERGRPRMKFEAYQEVRVLGRGEGRETGPVRRDCLLPLLLVHILQVGQPAAGPEMWHPIPRSRRRAAGHPDHTVDAEHRCQPDGIAQVSVVLAGYLLVGMQRVAPGIERPDAQSMRRDQVEPCGPARRAC